MNLTERIGGDCLENLQNLLPLLHFLASVSSALESNYEVDTYIQKKSLMFLTDRVAEVSPILQRLHSSLK